MPVTYKKIASVTVGSGGASSIEFSGIVSTYTDLSLLISLRSNRAAPPINEGVLLTFNNSSTGYSNRAIEGNGSSASSFTGSTTSINLIQATATNATASTFGSAFIYIPNYAGSTNKSVSIDYVTENNATSALAGLTAALWSNTSAITSLKLTPEVGTLWDQHSTATLYGISKS